MQNNFYEKHKIYSLDQFKQKSLSMRRQWFAASTTGFFKSRYLESTWQMLDEDTAIFVTSEKPCFGNYPRRYTIRIAHLKTLRVTTHGEPFQYHSRALAVRALQYIVKEERGYRK